MTQPGSAAHLLAEQGAALSATAQKGPRIQPGGPSGWDWVSRVTRGSTPVGASGDSKITSAKGSACNAGGAGLNPGSGRSPGEGNDNPLQCSCLETEAAWWATVHGVAKSRTRLSD